MKPSIEFSMGPNKFTIKILVGLAILQYGKPSLKISECIKK